MELKDKVTLITGASSGIGKELVKQLVKEGCYLAILARRLNLLNEIVEEVGDPGKNRILAIKCDVSNKEEVKNAYQKIIEKYNRIDIAILSAGFSKRMRVHEFNSEYAEKIYGANVFGIIYWTEVLIPEMMKRKNGVIAGVSSLSDRRGFSGSGFYCSSKAAATIFLEGLRTELADFNVKVITIKPGFVKTPLTDKNEFKMPMLMETNKAVKKIINGIKKEKKVIQFPWQIALSSKIIASVPNFIYDYFVRKFYH